MPPKFNEEWLLQRAELTMNLWLAMNHLQCLCFGLTLIALEKSLKISHHLHGHSWAPSPFLLVSLRTNYNIFSSVNMEENAKTIVPKQQINFV